MTEPKTENHASSSRVVRPQTAFVLAAGLGKRMRPLTDNCPKPLIRLAGKPLIDYALDSLAAAGITRAIVNVHYLADQIEQHVARRKEPAITISDERRQLLETGGGIVKALPLLGDAPIVVHNSDTLWIDHGRSNLERLIDAWQPDTMDTIMLLAPTEGSLGYSGDGDFHRATDGKLTRRKNGERAPYVFAGVSIIRPGLFAGEPEEPFSLNRIWDRSIAAGRVYGIVLDGLWMHVGTSEALREAEAVLASRTGDRAP